MQSRLILIKTRYDSYLNARAVSSILTKHYAPQPFSGFLGIFGLEEGLLEEDLQFCIRDTSRPQISSLHQYIQANHVTFKLILQEYETKSSFKFKDISICRRHRSAFFQLRKFVTINHHKYTFIYATLTPWAMRRCLAIS